MQSLKENNDNAPISEINVTPLVDVMLILMIIFLITAPLLVKKLGVNLPNAAGSQISKSTSKRISIKANGHIFFEGKEVSKQALEKKLANLSSDTIIKIAADKKSHYQDVASVLSILSRKNITNVGFLTQN